MKRTIEIRAAEGGEDSKLFVMDLAQAYVRMSERLGWRYQLGSPRLGEAYIHVEGPNLTQLENEVGGHRIQRVPPTERKGRVHTSTVTVAIIDPTRPVIEVKEQDLKVEWYSGTGCGGQNRNKVQSSCRLTHIPTGIVVTAQTRSRTNSYNQALTTIQQRVDQITQQMYNNEVAQDRKQQVGTGMRGDKIRTYRFQDDTVKDHVSNRTANLKKIMTGQFELLWN